MGARLYNLWLSQQTIRPLLTVWGGEWGVGGPRKKAEETEERESDALLLLLSYGWRRSASMRAHAHLQQQGVHWASRPLSAPRDEHLRGPLEHEWGTDSPVQLCRASINADILTPHASVLPEFWKREGLEGWDSFSLMHYWLKVGY